MQYWLIIKKTHNHFKMSLHKKIRRMKINFMVTMLKFKMQVRLRKKGNNLQGRLRNVIRHGITLGPQLVNFKTNEAGTIISEFL